jgi:hypothetical protein
MKIPVHHSLKVARKVVGLIDLPKDIANNCSIESWSNCREQGLFIDLYGKVFGDSKGVCIAENRNSDHILVIAGLHKNFDIQTNQPSEEDWKNRQLFDYNEHEKAARFIEGFLNPSGVKDKSKEKTKTPKETKEEKELKKQTEVENLKKMEANKKNKEEFKKASVYELMG